jgi:hypothetical protein
MSKLLLAFLLLLASATAANAEANDKLGFIDAVKGLFGRIFQPFVQFFGLGEEAGSLTMTDDDKNSIPLVSIAQSNHKSTLIDCEIMSLVGKDHFRQLTGKCWLVDSPVMIGTCMICPFFSVPGSLPLLQVISFPGTFP